MTEGSEVVRHSHPGSGRRRRHFHGKGRQVDTPALAEVRALLGDRPRRRDLLIEFLHLIQDHYRHLSAAHVAALADELRLAQTEVYEVATFYHHFDVVKEGETAPAPLTVRVCDSITCAMTGGEALLARLKATAGKDVRVVHGPCMGGCDRAPCAAVGRNQIVHATVEAVSAAIAAKDVAPRVPAYVDFDAYVKAGGYGLLKACLAGRHTPEAIIDILDNAKSAASAAPGSRPGASGGWSAPSRPRA